MTIIKKNTSVHIDFRTGSITIKSTRNGVQQVVTCVGRTVVVQSKGTK